MSDRCSQTFEEVLRAELDIVGDDIPGEESPVEARQDGTNVVPPAEDQIARAHKKQLVGLAFSGGGIRSATFNLGVVQALAQMRLLGRFNYLSTVSGGGYIGAWLMAWLKRRGMKDVAQALRPEWATQPGHREPGEIHFLRQFSNYLTPKLGWLGADMWTVIATYIRNLILNLTVLIAAMTLLLILPRVIAITFRHLWGPGTYSLWVAIALVPLIVAMVAITRSLTFFRRNASDRRGSDQTHEQFEWRDAAWLVRDGEVEAWKNTDAGPAESLAEALLNRNVFFEEEFQDFVLKAEFTADDRGRSAIAVWCPPDKPDDGHFIHVCGAFAKWPHAGAIDKSEPVHPASLRPAKNDLEISCVKNAITVRINGETINQLRVSGSTASGPECFRRGRWQSGWLGLRQSDGVQFHNVRVRNLPSNLTAGGTQGQIQIWIVTPLFVAAFIATFLFCFGDKPANVIPDDHSMRAVIDPGAPAIIPLSWKTCALVSGGLAAALILLVRCGVVGWEMATRRPRPVRQWGVVIVDILRETWSFGTASLLGGCGILALYYLFRERSLWEVVAWGTPALMGLTMLVLTVHIGLLGKSMPDELREWWSRLGAWLLIYMLGWVAVFVTAFYATPFLEYIADQSRLVLKSVGVAWIASTLWGVYSARSAATGSEKSSTIRDLVAQITPYIFIIGLFLLLSWGLDLLIPAIAHKFQIPLPPMSGGPLARHWPMMDAANQWLPVGIVAAAALLVSLVFSWRLDINQFSMHLLYRNRLGRCYLGASNRFRRAQPFTGFAADDDFNLWELNDLLRQTPRQDGAASSQRMTAPYLIINAALNLVGGKELAWQQRKAASFVFTQKYCGYDFPELPPGYSPTPEYAASVSPVTLATAMAISGAAASPNMGYHTSPASAFLMTVFNVRLGWWLGNPRSATWERSSPGNVLVSLLRELFGLTSDEGKYIYLSDGGHFENLGIYELVRRRCRFILACDAEEDHDFNFSGLGNAIEKCRSDLGVDIEIDVEPIRRRNERGHTHWHCAIGKIHYSSVDEDQPDGILVYLKSSLTGDEPSDVLRYAAENAGFPHQSTGDQWFDESQFESYRVLGCHIAEEVFGAVDSTEKLSLRSKEQLFVELAQRWYPPSDATKESFTRLTEQVMAIYEQLQTDKNLLFLNEQVYPAWRILFKDIRGADQSTGTLAQVDAKSLRSRLPQKAEELQAGFYMCSQIIQVMENTYVDLALEDEYDHPDNRGWMNFFRHWSWAPMFRVTWAVTASTYGARFQSFCERHLELKLGGVEMDNLDRQATTQSGPQLSAAAQSVNRALAGTVGRWLGTGLPCDPKLRSRAKAEAAKFAADQEESIPEEKILEAAQAAICEAVDRKVEGGAGPGNAQVTEKDPEWFAAATLLEMIRRRVAKGERANVADTVADFILRRGAGIADVISATDIQEELNAAERELLKLFLVYNPKLTETARILRFYLVPGRETEFRHREKRNDRGELRFPFAFAILARINDQAKESLVYFRVQDHVRRMGLGRQSLQKMLFDLDVEGGVSAELYEMHPDAHEVPTSNDRLRFLRLFDSAESALRQTGRLS